MHLAQEKDEKRIRKNGIRSVRLPILQPGRALFCMPVIGDFMMTHQWLRELRRSGKKNFIGVYFRLRDQEPVWAGFYNAKQELTTAGRAVKTFLAKKDKLGFQVLVPRPILPGEIIKMKRLPQNIGWRYYPLAHGKKPCLCPACLALAKGEFRAGKMRREHLKKQGES